jgi:sugar lactone lactonase YvrE
MSTDDQPGTLASGDAEGVAASSTFEAGTAALEAAQGRRGPMPRQIALLVALVLLVVLLMLLLYLLLAEGPAGSAEPDAPRAGLQSVLVLTGPGKGSKPTFKQPMSAAWGTKDRIYVADTGNNRIVVFNKSGKFLFEFGTFGIAKPLAGSKVTWKPGSLNYPTGVAVDTETGDVYVADFYNNTIEVFDSQGKFLRNFPDPNKVVGKGGSGINGTGIAVTDVSVRDGLVYATDAFQVLVFEKSGKLVEQFGRPGDALGDLDRPNGIAWDDGGEIVVSDSNHSRVTRYSAKGEPIQTVGKQVTDLTETTDNPFVLPRGLTVLDDRSVIVADPLSMRLVKLSPAGAVERNLGERGEAGAQFNFPNDVDDLGTLLLVADRGNDRVQVVRMVER